MLGRTSPRAIVIVLSGLAFGAGECPPPPGDAGPDAGGPAVWETAFDTAEAGSVSGVWGSGPDDVWAVGGNEDGATVFHWDGSAWTKDETVPDVGLLVWAYGWGPDNMMAVGVDGACVRYTGTWSTCDSGTDADLWGVFGFREDDVWIVGGDTDGDDVVILNWDGSTVTPVTLPAGENPTGAVSLFKVWGIDGRLWAVGQRGLIVEYTGGEWKRQGAGPEANDDFVSLWGTSADNVVAVGGRSNARIATFDGSSWSTVAPTATGGLNAVFMDDPSSAVVGGVVGTVGRYAPGAEDITLDEADTRWDVHAIWGDGAGTYYAVGGNFLAPYRGVALVLRE